nr:resolvase [Streptomyces sp. NBC_00857]
MRAAYPENRSIAAFARDHGVSRGAIRTAVADLLPDHTGVEDDIPAPELLVTLDMPGKVADFVRSADLEPAERAASDHDRSQRQRLCRCSRGRSTAGTHMAPGQRKPEPEPSTHVT